MERWLLLSNCQTFGLANSLMLACPTLEVSGLDLWTYQKDSAGHNARLADYDRVIVHPDIAHLPAFDPAAARCVNYLPSLDFGAYHPDTGYFAVDDVVVEGPMTAYQPMLAVAGHQAGLSLADTRALFRGPVFEACGYMARWQGERDLIVQRFRDHGVDVSDGIRRWGRERAFMYTVNHPRIEPLVDIACAFLSALGMETSRTDIVPYDNMVAGPCLPIYPEIAEALGVRGSHLFKPSGVYRYVTLDEVLAQTFALLDRHPPGSVQPLPVYRQHYAHVLDVVKGQA